MQLVQGVLAPDAPEVKRCQVCHDGLPTWEVLVRSEPGVWADPVYACDAHLTTVVRQRDKPSVLVSRCDHPS